MFKKLTTLLFTFFLQAAAFAGEADLKIPTLRDDQNQILLLGLVVCLLGLGFGIYQFFRVKNLKAHKSMLDVANIIFETCKTYLLQQGKFLVILFVFHKMPFPKANLFAIHLLLIQFMFFLLLRTAIKFGW